MKLSAFVAIAAVIGGSYLIPAPAEAKASECLGLYGSDLNDCQLEKSRKSSATRRANISRNCPDGTSYHKIKTGGLIFKKTIAEGCFTSYQAAQLKMQAAGIEQQRRNAIMSNDTCTFFGNTMQCY